MAKTPVKQPLAEAPQMSPFLTLTCEQWEAGQDIRLGHWKTGFCVYLGLKSPTQEQGRLVHGPFTIRLSLP